MYTSRQVINFERVYLFTYLRFYFSQMRRFPFFDNVCKGKLHFVRIERIPAQFRADSLFFEFGAAPDEGCSNNADDDRAPVILNEEGCSDDEKTNAHHVNPTPITEISFAANDEWKTKPNDEQGEDADENAECVHSVQ